MSGCGTRILRVIHGRDARATLRSFGRAFGTRGDNGKLYPDVTGEIFVAVQNPAIAVAARSCFHVGAEI